MKKLLLALLLSVVSAPSYAGTALVAVGGGDRPVEAMKAFVDLAGGEKARVLVVLWNTGEPVESLASIREDLKSGGLPDSGVEVAPLAPLDAGKRAQLMAQLDAATGIFFSGGDQNRAMAVLTADRPLLEAIRARYAAGVPIGGTSAGTAMMSTPMITGEGDFTVLDGTKVEVKEGLGLLPDVILDQHFVKRQRQNRLFGLVLENPRYLGVGVDEDAAVVVRDGRSVEVVGRGPGGVVLVVDGKDRAGALLVTVLKPGDRFDLATRARQ